MDALDTIRDQTSRSLWSLRNVVLAVPGSYWEKDYCAVPLWKHVYHTVHSLDRWYMNPNAYEEPAFHTPGLNDLDIAAGGHLSREELLLYLDRVGVKILDYLDGLAPELLQSCPEHCAYTRFHLIMAQHRHLDMHIGILMGFVIAGTGRWPKVMGLETDLEGTPKGLYF